jgi:hypothetical protein
MREAMITGRIVYKDGSGTRRLRDDLRRPLFILNKYIEASIRHGDDDNFTDKIDTNEIIHMIYAAIGEEVNERTGDWIPLMYPVGIYGNPMDFYNGLYGALGGDLMPWLRIEVRPSFGYYKMDDLNHIFLEQFDDPDTIYKMIYLEIYDGSSGEFEKPIEFTVDIAEDDKHYNCTYKLDSAVLRDVQGKHFSSYITCNGTELGSDGCVEDRLQPFQWKRMLNDGSTGSWNLAAGNLCILSTGPVIPAHPVIDIPPPLSFLHRPLDLKKNVHEFDFTNGHQILVYYLTNKKLNRTGIHGTMKYKV